MLPNYTRDEVCSLSVLLVALAMSTNALAQAQGEDALVRGQGADHQATPRVLDMSLTAGSTWSDNVGLHPPNAEDEGTIGQLAVGLLWQEERRRLRADVDVDVSYQHYFDDEFDDDLFGGIDGMLLLGLVPERIEWLIQENFGQTRIDPLGAVTPNNREDINHFTTGPDVTLRFGQATSLRLSGRYSATDYETSVLDGTSRLGMLSLIRHLSPASALSLSGSHERVEYDDEALGSKYDRQEAFVRYEMFGRRTGFAVDAGYTRLDDDIDTSGGELVRLALTRRMSESSTVEVNLGSEFSDAGRTFRTLQDLGGVSLEPEIIIATSDALRRRFASFEWDFSRHRTFFGLNGQWTDEQYEHLSDLDRSLVRYGIYAGRQLARHVRLRVDVRYLEQEFETLTATSEEFLGIATLEWALGPRLSWRLQYDYRDRSGTGGTVAEYEENRVSMFVTWSPLARR